MLLLRLRLASYSSPKGERASEKFSKYKILFLKNKKRKKMKIFSSRVIMTFNKRWERVYFLLLRLREYYFDKFVKVSFFFSNSPPMLS